MNLDDALGTFIVESRELLENMETALLGIEQSPDDPDLINAIFRAAHTIKGSAGLFGFDHVVGFTHHAENVLDRVRAGKLAISGELIALLLEVRDHLGALIDQLEQGATPADEALARSERLVASLHRHAGEPAPAAPMPPAADAGRGREENDGADGVATDNWHISLRFGRDVLRNGMDPIAFIRYLGTFGQIASIVTLTDAIPPADAMDPEDCYLGFEINYRSETDKATIEAAFEFVRDDARIAILPPHSKIGEYLELIGRMADGDMPLGEILVRCGTLTRGELETALRTQAAASEPGQAKAALGEVLVANQVVRPAVVEAALEKQKLAKENRLGDAALIRVNADKLDQHINLIGELIIASAGISLSAQNSGLPELLEAASVMKRLVEDVRDSALQLRMVQIGATFSKFQRVVRDVAKEIGKDIRLEINGADTELDKTVVEKIGDPLTHLVRNSMDHGIEPAEIRLARGKPPHGTLRLNAYHDSGSIAIEVSDDGGGLPRQRILAKAIERGLVKPDQMLDDAEIDNLIFEPGFSTAEQVNNLSGRGVGMDVVRRNIAALRGSTEIESAEGMGTTIRIRLPLTLAIIDGFLVGVGDSAFVLPLDLVEECVEIGAGGIEAANGQDYLDLRGEILPFIRLRRLFDIAETSTAGPTREEDGPAARPTAARRENVVVVNYAGRRAGLVVDTLQGEYQTVIRPLGPVFAGLRGLGGFTILGSGRVALILDVPNLVSLVSRQDVRRAGNAAGSSPAAPR